jgi:hypothetical protein
MCRSGAEFCLEEGAGELWAAGTELEEAVAAACGGLEERVALPHGDELDEDSGEPVAQRVHLDEHRLYDFMFLSDMHNRSLPSKPHYTEALAISTPRYGAFGLPGSSSNPRNSREHGSVSLSKSVCATALRRGPPLRRLRASHLGLRTENPGTAADKVHGLPQRPHPIDLTASPMAAASSALASGNTPAAEDLRAARLRPSRVHP